MTLSIITPSYHQGDYIEKTLRSVLDQSIPGLSYSVIDGGSADQTLEILKKYEHQLSWSSEKDSGQANAINKGFKKASGDIIGWLNSDDLYYPGSLETVLDFFHMHPDIDFLYGDANHIDAQDAFINRYPTRPWNLKKLLQRCYLSQPAVFFRRSVFEKIGYLDESLQYCMDYEFWLRAATAGLHFFYLPKTLAATRLHPSAKTIGQALAARKEQMQMILRYRHNVPLRMRLSYLHAWLKRQQ